jgi:hypothetical protein
VKNQLVHLHLVVGLHLREGGLLDEEVADEVPLEEGLLDDLLLDEVLQFVEMV